jgi:hypothetical protein
VKSLSSAEVLSETRERLLSVRADDRALWGKMTATQMVRHLGCSYELALGDRIVASVKGPPPVVLKWLALRSGLRWAKNLKGVPELGRAVEEESAVSFEERVETAVKTMEAVAGGKRWHTVHPMFGQMTAGDWMRWGYLHADHHLRQFGR